MLTRFKHKYSAKKSTCQKNHSHASKLEASICGILHLRERANEIKVLQIQDHVYLTDARILYIPDFKCVELKSDEVFWVEAKGMETPEYRLKRKLWKVYGPGKLEVWKGSYKNPFLAETINIRGKDNA